MSTNPIIGMMSLTKEEGKGWIKQLYIDPDAVGQRIGTLLIQKAKSILDSRMYLYTFKEIIRVKHFYEGHGFVAIDFDYGSSNEEHCPGVLYKFDLA
jgi:ribosomal protein S18 acetylase RimI-like enzyme